MGKAFLNLQTALQRRGWIALPVMAAAAGSALLYLATAAPIYRTSNQIIVDEKEVSVSDLGQGITGINSDAPGKADPIATQAELLLSQGVLQQAIAAVEAEQPNSELPSTKALRRAANVDILPGTNILRLSVEGENPELAAKLANAIANAAVAENIETIRREASVVREFLEDKIPQQQTRLREAEVAEGDYRQASGIISLEAQTNELVNQVAALEAERNQTLALLEEAVTRDRQLQQITDTYSPETAYNSVLVGQDETLQSLEQERTELEVTIADASTRLGEQHPDWLALIEEREALNQLYQQRLAALGGGQGVNAGGDLSQSLLADYITSDIERQGLESRLAVIDGELASLDARLLQIPVQQQPLATLTRQRQEAEAALQFLQSKLEEARLAEAQLLSNVRIIGQAEVPQDPVAPQPLAVLVLALVAGGALSAALMVLLEATDMTLRTAAAVESALKLPVLGMLPKTPHRQGAWRLEAFLDTPERVEPYRSLLKTLSFQRRTSKQLRTFKNGNGNGNGNGTTTAVQPIGQTIVITSPYTNEGKSTVAAHLAATAAMLSKRTLLIDADFRSPCLDQLLELPAYPGLTEAMTAPETLPEIVKATPVDNLFVLTHGQLFNRPSTLAESEAIRHLLASAAAEYDMVIIDTAPASSCADAATLSQYTDGLLLTLKAGVSQRAAAVHVASELKKSGATVLGVALSNVKPGQESMYAEVSNDQLQLLPYTSYAPEATQPDSTSVRV